MNESGRTFIGHILESIILIEEYAAGISKRRFLELVEKQDAIIRTLLIISRNRQTINML